MLKSFVVVCALALAGATASAQDKKFTVDDFAGTWNIEVMSHQVALVIEKQDANKVTATMMMMGRDVPLKGELVDRTITFVGVKTEGEGGGHLSTGRPCQTDRRHDAGRWDARRRDDDQQRSREVDCREAEDAQEAVGADFSPARQSASCSSQASVFLDDRC